MNCRNGILFFIIGVFLPGSGQALAGWDTGVKAGFDSNVSRSISGNGKSAGFFSAYAGYSREPSGDHRQDWFFTVVGEGTAHTTVSDLDSISATFSPGWILFLRPAWTFSVSPFLQGKSVQDGNQSAVAVGGRLQMKQRLQDDLTLGEYYAYTDSHAHADVFSYGEHVLGVTLGKTFSSKISGELGYEYGRGDSFRSVGGSPAAGGAGGTVGGMSHMFSSAFGSEVFRERVTRHSIGASAEYDWTQALFSTAGYTYTSRQGELGSTSSHYGFAGVGYRF